MTSVFPSVLKTAKVVSVFKKDLQLVFSNYRAICLLSNIEKILEKLICERFYAFLNKNNVIYNLQVKFRQQYCSSHVLINITDSVRKSLGDENIGCGVSIDLKKAFDSVDHQIPLAKLNHYYILGVSNDWFKSYLSNRNQYVSIYGYVAALNCGVPQGSVMFLLHINDLNQAIKFCKNHHFVNFSKKILQSLTISPLFFYV